MLHLIEPVAQLMRQVAHSVVLPRYQRLLTSEVEEKSPGELVTIADRESEAALSAGLLSLMPDAKTLGEEAVAANPQLMADIGRGALWIIDPIDGTANFAAGRPHFALMIGLAIDGIVEAGWIYDPLADRLCHAVCGGGAWINGSRVFACESGAALPIAGIGMKFMDDAKRADCLARISGKMALAEIPLCAGEQYPRVVLGQNDVALFERVLPWDHAPGALFVEESGGKTARPDGTPYHFWDGKPGLLTAGSATMWDRAAKILYA